ncbi:hypothetical protein HY837_03780 [archaeon]|nr:hypothetical protein [archaeon]
MRSWILVLIIFLVLAACSKNNTDTKSSQQIVDLYTAQETKKLIDKELGVNKVEKKKVKEEAKSNENIVVNETLPYHSCAMFSEEDALKFCNMPKVGSEFLENELHDSCNQQFRSIGRPYYYVNIRYLRFNEKEEAVKKLAIDRASYQGTKDSKNKNLFWKETETTRMAEFLIGSRIVRLSETEKGKCEKFEELVKTAFARGG